MPNVLVMVTYPDTVVRYYQFKADDATLEDIKHVHARTVHLNDDEPFAEEFAEEYEDYEVEESEVDCSRRQVFWFTVSGVPRDSTDSTIKRPAGEVSAL